jgi:transposase
VLVAAVPWARPDSWFTTGFEAQVAWLTLHACRSVVAEVRRIDWKTVGGVIARVQADLGAVTPSPFQGLVNIGIDETSYKKGQKYMTVVVDHDRNRVVWAAPGHGKQVLESFFALLTDEQKTSIRCVTADGARWIADVVAERCPNAVRALDPFHTVSWATDAVDEVRRQAWRDARRDAAPRLKRGPGRPPKGVVVAPPAGTTMRGARYALLKNPEDLTATQRARLDLVAATNPVVHRAYLLKEKLRLLLKLPADEAEAELTAWLGWAQRCRIPVFVELGRKIKRHFHAILDTIRLGLTNARVEATNNKIKLTIRMGYGFRNIDNLIALIMLKCGGHHLTLPGRQLTHTSS